MMQPGENDSDELHELRMAVGAGAAEALGALSAELAALVGAVTLASAQTFRVALEAGVSPNVAAGMTVGAALEGVMSNLDRSDSAP